jgi:3-hydroxyacyl-[acyl-carrier-protein] dehydratase
MLDRIVEMEAGKGALAIKAVTSSEDYFEHHFPLFEVVPGSMLVEIMAQLGGRLLAYTWEKKSGVPCWPALAFVEEARFLEYVRPGSQMQVLSTFVEVDTGSGVSECEIRVDDRPHAVATIGSALTPFELDKSWGPLALAHFRGDMRTLWTDYDL